MAITKIDFPTASTPSYTPSISTDYNNQNENIERSIRGKDGVSLTFWDESTTAPQVSAGSVIESNGVYWDISTDTSISTSGASAGIVYLAFDDTVPEFKFINTAPSWSATLNGWYSSGLKCTGHRCDWDGSTSYSYKRIYSRGSQTSLIGARGFFIDGGISSLGILAYAPADVGTYVFFEPGLLHLHDIDNNTSTDIGSTAFVFYYDGLNYRTVARTPTGLTAGQKSFTTATMFSNGNNYCAYCNTALSPNYISYEYTRIL